MESFIIRCATEADQDIIVAIIQEANINPNGLDWHHFMAADDDGQIIGTGQIKSHWDGSRELASIATVPDRQKEGIAAATINALLQNDTEPLYLMCEKRMESFYPQFGFRALFSTNAALFCSAIRYYSAYIPVQFALYKRRTSPQRNETGGGCF